MNTLDTYKYEHRIHLHKLTQIQIWAQETNKYKDKGDEHDYKHRRQI